MVTYAEGSPPNGLSTVTAGFRLGGLLLQPRRLEDATAWIVEQALAEIACVVVTSHISHLMYAAQDAAFRDAVERSELNIADGWPLVAASRLLRPALPARVIGIDLVEAVLAAGPRLRLAILGGPPGSAEAVAERERHRHDIVAIEALPTGVWEADEELQSTFVRLAAARPNLVLVGLGVPKQELLADRLRPYVAGPVLCCGATIPVLAGAVRRAPAPVRRFGVEWAYRIGQSPVRMAPRYVRTGSWFFWTLAREMTLRLGRSRTRLPEQ